MELFEPAVMDVTLELDILMICKHCRIVINTRRGMQVATRGILSRCTARPWEDSSSSMEVICTRQPMRLLLREEVKVDI